MEPRYHFQYILVNDSQMPTNLKVRKIVHRLDDHDDQQAYARDDDGVHTAHVHQQIHGHRGDDSLRDDAAQGYVQPK
ncbi:MAG: hypothetical protein IT221_16155 [Fluviicola sp.]|nr:hypothetical protein [Fluviicola sp.]